MAEFDPDANITMISGPAEDEWYRNGKAVHARYREIQHSLIIIPEALSKHVRVRREPAEEMMVVRVIRGGSPKAHATLH
ncbi:hypothetical protein [Rhizobium sp.]